MPNAKLASLAGLVGAAVMVAAIVPPAFAADPDAPMSLKVSIADLNLKSDAGAHEALARIQRAARHVCGDGDVEPGLTQQVQFHNCVSQAVQHAVAAINAPALTAVSPGRHVDTAMASAAH
ncbi:MAG TPA: UrcA family protein [Caulobacteraceae bacterium]|nr:UrcA family protein [Caulobacteraceae bacterium]